MNSLEERYVKMHPKSATLYESAKELFPDGVTHDGRRFSPFPVYMNRGRGSHKWDIDENEYIDYRTGHGSMILGQAHPKVVQAVSEQLAKGTHLSACTELEVRWGQWVKELVPCAEKLRFLSSGTEAIMMSFRMARVFSGKTKIVKFQDAFHGWYDHAFVGASNDNPQDGVTPNTRQDMIVVPLNDIGAVERTLQNNKDVAAVIFQGNTVVRPSFLQQLREVTRQYGVILIFDEVVSGFRWAKGGCQDRFNVVPDLAALAKILSGGLPGGAVAGRAEIIDTIQAGKISHPGTFNANPLSAAAGSTALEIVATEPINATADARAQQLKDGLNDVLNRMEIPGCAHGVSSVVSVRLGVSHECDKEFCILPPGQAVNGLDSKAMHMITMGLINNGIYANAGGFMLSAIHSTEDVNRTVATYENTLKEARSLGAV